MDEIKDKFNVTCKGCKAEAQIMFTNGNCQLFKSVTPRMAVICTRCGSHTIIKDSFVLDSVIKCIR